MKKMDLVFISIVVVLLLGYSFIRLDRSGTPPKSRSEKSMKSKSEDFSKSLFTNVSKPVKKNDHLFQGHTRSGKSKTVSNQQLKAKKSPAEHHEKALQYYRLINGSVEQVIQNYKKNEREVLQVMQSKKRDIENYESMMKEVKPSAEDLLFIVKATQGMSIASIEGAVSTIELLLQFVEDANNNLQQASLHYGQSGREWNHKDKMEFTRHIQNIVHRTEEANQYFSELRRKVDQCKKLINKFIDLSASSLNLVAEVGKASKLKDKGMMDDKAKKAFKEEKQWESKRISAEAKGLEENIDNKLKEIDWLFKKLESHVKVTVQTFDKAAKYFPIKRGLSGSIKKLENILSQQKSN